MHPEFRLEVAHLDHTKKHLAAATAETESDKEKSQTRVEKLQKQSSGYDDELQVAMNVHRGISEYYDNLIRAKEKPYFGRVDFKRDDEKTTNPYYIGKVGIMNEETGQPFIVDWRAPVASLYYGGELGEVMFTAPEGVVFGDMPLKRQYQIEDSELVNVFDKNIAPVDEFLNLELGKSKDNRLTDIVSTIQSEQNAIIRHPKDKFVVVQGVAGSGKTTIVLHRMAYLLYNHQDTLKPEQILMIMPNQLFLDYVSDVLPDLGVHHIEQKTFNQLALVLQDKVSIIPDRFIEDFFEGQNGHQHMQAISSLKSEAFRSHLDSMVKQEEAHFELVIEAVATTFKLNPDDYKKVYLQDYKYLPVYKRLPKVTAMLDKALKERWTRYESSHKDRLLKSVKAFEEEAIERREAFDTYNAKMASDKAKLTEKIKNAKAMLKPRTVIDLFERAVTDYGTVEADLLINIKKKQVNEVVIGQYLYMHEQLLGLNDEQHYAHIVVDEAQDFNIFQYHILKKLNRANIFTIVGDLNQGIRSYRGIDKWSDIAPMAPKHKRTYDEIVTCYRSTKQIVTAANTCLDQLEHVPVYPKPVIREGSEPVYIKGATKEDVKEQVIAYANRFKTAHSVAILTPDSKWANELKPVIEEAIGQSIHLIDDQTKHYEGGYSIMPIYEAKGLEFDAVILIDLKHENPTELHHKMKYVAMTRALHELVVIEI